MRRFKLLRSEDLSGNSGTGFVAEGCQFENGWCAMTWYGIRSSYCWYPSIEVLESLHGHEGRTKVSWIDQ